MKPLLFSLAAGLTSLLSGSLLLTLWPARPRLSQMTGMMVAMTAGMLTGLIIGTGAPLLVGGLWAATLLGVLAGLLVSLLVGLPSGLLALLDGGLAGLMGGMMGAMLGVMAPEAIGPTLFLLLLLYGLAWWGLQLHLGKELGLGHRHLGRGRPLLFGLLAGLSLMMGLLWG